jgi:hypothetical protein
MIKLTQLDPLTEKHNTMELDITSEQYLSWKYGNTLIQDAFPNLTPDEREFIKTGITPDSWDKIFNPTTQ